MLHTKAGLRPKLRARGRGIHRVSPEEEQEGYGGKDLQKRKVLGLG